jgi:hypothetical protein
MMHQCAGAFLRRSGTQSPISKCGIRLGLTKVFVCPRIGSEKLEKARDLSPRASADHARAIFMNSKPQRGLPFRGEGPLSAAIAFYSQQESGLGGLFDKLGGRVVNVLDSRC